MEQEILRELQQIHEILIRLAIIVVIGVFLWMCSSVLSLVRNSKSIANKTWNDVAQRTYEEGDFQRLLEISSKRLDRRPNQVGAIYYMILAKEGLKDLEGIESLVKKLKKIGPSWKEDWMDKYLVEGESNLGQQVAGGDATR